MPELPEVENLRRGLLARIKGQKIRKITVFKPKLVSGKGNLRRASRKKALEFARKLKGETIADIERRAKNLIFHMRSGKVILVHLKMSGQLVYKEKGKKSFDGGHPIELSESVLPNKHTRVIFELTKGTLFYNDIRMFGYLLYYPDLGSLLRTNHFHDLGMEPFDEHFTQTYLAKELKKRKSPIKTALMDQKIVAGLGNIYCDEALFSACIKPTRRANTLQPNEVKMLHLAIQRILSKAIEMGGSSVATYRLADGSRGNYAREHRVYNKAGKPCVKCGEKLRSIKMNGRTTVFCAECQI